MKKKWIPVLMSFSLLMVSCGKSTGTPEAPLEQKSVLTDTLFNTVSVDTVCSHVMHEELLLNGRVDFDMEKVAHVYSMFSGSVEKVYVEAGDYVEQGAPLTSIRSEEVADMAKELDKARQALVVAERNLKAAEDMKFSGVASELDLLRAQQEAIDAKADLERISKRYSIYSTEDGVFYTIKAPVSGFITERRINPNIQLRQDFEEAVFTIVGLEQVWIMADVYESDISKVHENMPVCITTLAYGEQEFHGTIDRVYQTLDDESKTMNIRIKLRNDKHLLKPGMFANVYVRTDRGDKEVPRVDARSVIFENGKHYVIAVKGKELRLQQVSIGKRTPEYCYLTDGVKAGDTIIGRNALLIYNILK